MSWRGWPTVPPFYKRGRCSRSSLQFGLLLYDCGNPAALVGRGERYDTAAPDGFVHQAIAPNSRGPSGDAHGDANPCHIEGAWRVRQIKSDGPAIGEVERVAFTRFRA